MSDILKSFFNDITIREKVIISPILYTKAVGDKGERTRLNYTITNADELTFIKCGIGAAHIGDLTLALGKTACKRAYLVGTVGGISEKLNIGDIFISDNATDGESFSGWLKGRSINQTYEPAKTLTSGLKNIFPNAISGKVLTMGSLLAQNKENTKGFDALDMESSAFFAAAAKAGIEASGIYIVSDLPLKQPLYQTTTDQQVMVKTRLNEILQAIIKI
jgi:purine-nucleoside phosphorylase